MDSNSLSNSSKKEKPRLVFDSSATYKGTSLNDQLLSGPDLNNRLRDVLIGFRDGYIGFSADVESMFHSFYLKPEDRDYMRFYWFKNNDASQDLCQYRAKVHIFGNTSSPSLASLGLRYAVQGLVDSDHVKEFVNEQFYVDDGLSCADTKDDAVKVMRDTISAFSGYNIRLHKICSSSTEVTAAFPISERAEHNSIIELDSDTVHSTLGLMWDMSSDTLIVRSQVADRQ